MNIVVLCDGTTEVALRDGLREFVQARGLASRVGIQTRSLNGTTLRAKLATLVENHSKDPNTCGIIALTDVHPNYDNAQSAKDALTRIVADVKHGGKFRAHVAKFDVEAWLIPFWDEICTKLGIRAQRPGAKPEEINDQTPPSYHIKELFRRAKTNYEKPIDARKWLSPEGLERAAHHCPELKSFLNSLLEFAGSTERL